MADVVTRCDIWQRSGMCPVFLHKWSCWNNKKNLIPHVNEFLLKYRNCTKIWPIFQNHSGFELITYFCTELCIMWAEALPLLTLCKVLCSCGKHVLWWNFIRHLCWTILEIYIQICHFSQLAMTIKIVSYFFL